MSKKTIKDIDLKGKKVLVRCDLMCQWTKKGILQITQE